MRRVAAATLLLAACATASAQVRTVGLLWNDSVQPSPYRATVIAALKDKGYVVGGNLRVEDRISLEGYGNMAQGAAALARSKVDVIVAYGATATVAARKATQTIPIVTIIGADPVAMGLASSLSAPGANVTGVTTLGTSLHAKRFQMLSELVPRASRLGVLLAPGSSSSDIGRREIERGGQSFKLQLHFADVRKPADLEPAFAEFSRLRVDALYVQGATMLAAHADEIVALAAKHRIPAMYVSNRYLQAGGLIGYGPDVHQAFVLAVSYIDRILKGESAARLPIEQASKLELIVNLTTARSLGITVPQAILLRADRVIE